MDGRAFASKFAAGILWLAASLAAASADDLPLVHISAPPGTDGPLVLLLSGDGDWAAFPRAFGEAAANSGAPVLGLKTRAYLAHGSRTPAQIAADLEAPIRAELAASHREDLVIVGYSRGADWAPFIVNRWPADLRSRVRRIAFVGLSNHASFEFHLDDLFRDVVRPTDVPTRPEVEKLVGLPMLCAYGADEKDTFCHDPVAGMRAVVHTGAHRVKDDTELIDTLLRWLGLESAARPPPSSPSDSNEHRE
jgi:type IV secretory pathway VirJ component